MNFSQLIVLNGKFINFIDLIHTGYLALVISLRLFKRLQYGKQSLYSRLPAFIGTECWFLAVPSHTKKCLLIQVANKVKLDIFFSNNLVLEFTQEN